MKYLGIIVLLVTFSSAAAQKSPPIYRESAPFDLGREFGATQDWMAVVTAAVEPQQEIESSGAPSQSKICFVLASLRNKQCTYFRDLFESQLGYQGLSGLSVVRLKSEPHATEGFAMKAVAWYPTGQIQETAIWVYDKPHEEFHLAIALESSEVHIFSRGPLEGYLITANWHSEPGETRFGSNHKRQITVYQYIATDTVNEYRKAFEYTTASKYDPENTKTIDSEIKTIEARIRSGS